MIRMEQIFLIFAGVLLAFLALTQNKGNLMSVETTTTTKVGLTCISIANSYVEKVSRFALAFDDYTVANAAQPRMVVSTDSSMKLSSLSSTLGPESGETSQKLYDDIDDYNGLDTMVVVVGVGNFHVVCSINYFDPAANATTASKTWFKQFCVTVTDTIPESTKHLFQFNGVQGTIQRKAVIGYYHFI